MPTRQRGSVADVGDRLAAKLRRSGHTPSPYDQFALTIRAVAHDRRKLVGEDPGECAEQGAYGGLAFGFGVQVTAGSFPTIPNQ
jgi:hypothetical protein